MKQKIFLCAGILALAACKVAIKDGKIPEKYVAQAQAYAGVYHGQFEGRQMDLHLSLLQDGTVKLSVADLNGNPELVAACHSQVGPLISANVDTDQKNLKSARFAFNAGDCKLEGQTLDLVFRSQNEVNVSVVKSTHIVHLPGDTDCAEGANGHTHCHHTPGGIVHEPSEYLTGSFSK